jgi:hypothetical protein
MCAEAFGPKGLQFIEGQVLQAIQALGEILRHRQVPQLLAPLTLGGQTKASLFRGKALPRGGLH